MTIEEAESLIRSLVQRIEAAMACNQTDKCKYCSLLLKEMREDIIKATVV